jgi:hypothetical protein
MNRILIVAFAFFMALSMISNSEGQEIKFETTDGKFKITGTVGYYVANGKPVESPTGEEKGLAVVIIRPDGKPTNPVPVKMLSKKTKQILFGKTSNAKPDFLEKGLLAYYKLDGNAKDESGKGNHGRANGVILAKDRFDVAGQSFRFNGQSDVTAEIKGLPINAEARTVSCWVKVEPKDLPLEPSTHVLVQWGQKHPFRAFAIFFVGGKVKSFRSGPYTTDLESGVAVDSRWHHVLAVYDDTHLIYVDGVLRGAQTIACQTAHSELTLGREVDPPGCYFKGSLDDVRVYNRALPADEVKALYEYESKPPAIEKPSK